MKMTPEHLLTSKSRTVTQRINEFNIDLFRTKGGRLGSGMGLLLEGLWGYMMNKELEHESLSVAWIVDHSYNDFAVVNGIEEWDPQSRKNEVFRIEIKSMNLGADESKAHFDPITPEIGVDDQLVVLAWEWAADNGWMWPRVRETYLGPARKIAELRDELHLARGGFFVDRKSCPDGCEPKVCSHHGEPLNASGKRERLSGPESTRVSRGVSHAANFGGLVRMIKVRGPDARTRLERVMAESPEARSYVDFIVRIGNGSTQAIEVDTQ
jgi:hypothetical protein